MKIREYIERALAQAGVARVVIERPAKRARITIHTARPGVVIGKKGADIEKLRQDLSKMTGGDVTLNIVEIRKPEIDAKLVADNIAQQLTRRVAFRRAMKRAVQSAARLGAEGIGSNAAAASVVSKLPVPSGIAKAACRCIPCGPISTTEPRRRKPLTELAASRCGCSRARSWNTTRWPPNAASKNNNRSAKAVD